MWLALTDRPPTPHPAGGWLLRMMNGATLVKVRVTDEAVRRATPPDARDATIFTLRGTFRELANEKAARHEYESDGSITIHETDLSIRLADSRYA